MVQPPARDISDEKSGIRALTLRKYMILRQFHINDVPYDLF